MDDVTEKTSGLNHKLGEQRKANIIVPFPEEKIEVPDGDLEKYIKSLVSGGFPTYDKLPNLVTATSVETYLNWTGSLNSRKKILDTARGECLYILTYLRAG